jgi:hypothetical protein
MFAQKLLIALLALFAAASGAAWADRGYGGYGGYGGRGGVGVGVYIGGPVVRPYYPGYYARPYYAPRPYYYGAPYYSVPWVAPYYSDPTVVVVPSSPPVYVERGDGGGASPSGDAGQYWYFCRDANAYYPYVKDCPGGWQKVLPRPPE